MQLERLREDIMSIIIYTIFILIILITKIIGTLLAIPILKKYIL